MSSVHIGSIQFHLFVPLHNNVPIHIHPAAVLKVMDNFLGNVSLEFLGLLTHVGIFKFCHTWAIFHGNLGLLISLGFYFP